MTAQQIISLQARPRGFHLVTSEIEQKADVLQKISQGIAHILLMHTSAGLTLNENSAPSVRHDFGVFTEELVPEHFQGFTHTQEGPDDMPAHIKSSLYGASLVLPLKNGCFVLGQWQGIYLNEFRNHGGERRIVITTIGD